MVRQVRHFWQEEHCWTLNPNKRQIRTAYGLARELDVSLLLTAALAAMGK
jgi:hypothetical protein